MKILSNSTNDYSRSYPTGWLKQLPLTHAKFLYPCIVRQGTHIYLNKDETYRKAGKSPCGVLRSLAHDLPYRELRFELGGSKSRSTIKSIRSPSISPHFRFNLKYRNMMVTIRRVKIRTVNQLSPFKLLKGTDGILEVKLWFKSFEISRSVY